MMGGRWAKRVFCLVFVWGATMVAIMLISNHYPLATQHNLGPHVSNSRFLLTKIVLPPEATVSTTRASDFSLEPLVDKSPALSEAMIIEQVQQRLPSLPIAYWNKYKNRNLFYKNESCAKYPSIFELEFNNVYWQTLHTSNGTFHFYGAYYDVRKMSKIGPAVRILGMINRIEPTVKTYCQFWFANHKEPVLVKTMEYKYIWYKEWGNYKQDIYQPYLITCQIPQAFHEMVPTSVSIVEKICDIASNNLRVIYNKPAKKKGFAVCVKGLDFLYDDLSVRLIEWIELLGILGAEKIFFYELQVHPNISKVLNYYSEVGKVDVVPLTLPGGQPNIPGFQHLYLTQKVIHKRQNELIPYNDCLYKNLYSYEYIALLDIDEVIMPMKEMSWRGLMDTVLPKALALKNETRASYNVRNVYFLDDLLHEHGWFKEIPRYTHMLQHVYRSKNFTKPNQYVKCFHYTEQVLTLHNHFPFACLASDCTSYAIEVDDAQLQHYRADCVRTLKKTCNEYRHNSVIDTTIWKFKDSLVGRVTDALRTLGYFNGSGGVT